MTGSPDSQTTYTTRVNNVKIFDKRQMYIPSHNQFTITLKSQTQQSDNIHISFALFIFSVDTYLMFVEWKQQLYMNGMEWANKSKRTYLAEFNDQQSHWKYNRMGLPIVLTRNSWHSNTHVFLAVFIVWKSYHHICIMFKAKQTMNKYIS